MNSGLTSEFKTHLQNLVFLEKGYTTDLLVSPAEHTILKKFIKQQWLNRIQLVNPRLFKLIKSNNFDIKDHHQICSSLDHSLTWTKISRVLPLTFIHWFNQSIFFAALESVFGSFVIADEEELGWPNVYWRLVRPNEATDVGPLHRDSWFWEANNNYSYPNSKPLKRVKVWIPIIIEPGLNGLLVEPFSQFRKDLLWRGEGHKGSVKPVLLTNINQVNPILIDTSPGQAVIFNFELLHGGAINNGQFTRVRVEFTILLND